MTTSSSTNDSKTNGENPEMKFNTFPEFPKPTIKDKIQVGKLLSIQKVEQRTPEWYSLRMTMITASDWATAIGKGHFGNKNVVMDHSALALCHECSLDLQPK